MAFRQRLQFDVHLHCLRLASRISRPSLEELEECKWRNRVILSFEYRAGKALGMAHKYRGCPRKGTRERIENEQPWKISEKNDQDQLVSVIPDSNRVKPLWVTWYAVDADLRYLVFLSLIHI